MSELSRRDKMVLGFIIAVHIVGLTALALWKLGLLDGDIAF